MGMLNRMVSTFFDLAELRAMQHQPMYMQDWVVELDDFAKKYGQGVLSGAGEVSHQKALDKARNEYEKYKQKLADELSPVEKEFLISVKNTQKKLKGKVVDNNSSDSNMAN